MDIVLEEILDLCDTSHESRSFSARNITVLKVQEWLSHAQSSNPDLPETWANHFSVELFMLVNEVTRVNPGKATLVLCSFTPLKQKEPVLPGSWEG